jgi:hypothetical protein
VVRQACKGALDAMGEAVVTPLGTLLKTTDNPQVRQKTLEMLREMGTVEALQAIQRASGSRPLKPIQ